MPDNNNRRNNYGHSQRPNQRSQGNGQRHNNDTPVPNPYSGYRLKGNLGLLYTRRYYSGINQSVLNKDKITIVTSNSSKPRKTNHQEIYYASRNDNIIAQAKVASLPKSGLIRDSQTLELTTTYPGLITGIGIPHSAGHTNESILGLVFDHTTGLPYIPGSSVKGLLRSAFPMQDDALAKKCDQDAKAQRQKGETAEAAKLEAKAEKLHNQAEQKRLFIAQTIGSGFPKEQVDELGFSIFGKTEKSADPPEEQGYPLASRDIFFDAFPSAMGQAGLLGLDFIAPHTNGEFKDPNLIQFMRIEPGVTFRFEFRLHDSMLQKDKLRLDADAKLDLFSTILTTLGIGAKTNVGYGQLNTNKNEPIL